MLSKIYPYFVSVKGVNNPILNNKIRIMKRNFLNILKIGTCLMVAVTCATMLITGNVDEEVVDFIS